LLPGWTSFVNKTTKRKERKGTPTRLAGEATPAWKQRAGGKERVERTWAGRRFFSLTPRELKEKTSERRKEKPAPVCRLAQRLVLANPRVAPQKKIQIEKEEAGERVGKLADKTAAGDRRVRKRGESGIESKKRRVLFTSTRL